MPTAMKIQVPANLATIIDQAGEAAHDRLLETALHLLALEPRINAEDLLGSINASVTATLRDDFVRTVLTGELGRVTSRSPEGAVNVEFADGTNCRLAPSEFGPVVR